MNPLAFAFDSIGSSWVEPLMAVGAAVLWFNVFLTQAGSIPAADSGFEKA